MLGACSADTQVQISFAHGMEHRVLGSRHFPCICKHLPLFCISALSRVGKTELHCKSTTATQWQWERERQQKRQSLLLHLYTHLHAIPSSLHILCLTASGGGSAFLILSDELGILVILDFTSRFGYSVIPSSPTRFA